MPIYEFQCSSCNSVVEVIQKVSDPVPDTCPNCKAKDSLSRLISRTSFVLKGTGWYETDFKDKSTSGKANTATTETKHSSEGEGCSAGCSCCSSDTPAKTESTKESSTKATGTDGK